MSLQWASSHIFASDRASLRVTRIATNQAGKAYGPRFDFFAKFFPRRKLF